jgi:16S rRNA (cytosine967-C5)-methyltransferase
VTARDVARAVLGRVEAQQAWATPALSAALGKARLDDPRDRRLAAELVYGVLRQQSRLDRALGAYADLRKTPRAVVIALRVAAYQLLRLDRIPAHAAVDDAVDAVRRATATKGGGGDKLAGFTNAVLRRLAAAGEPPVPAGDRRARLEIEHSMPRWIIDHVAAALAAEGAGAGAVSDPAAELDAAVAGLSATAAPPPLWLRANLRRTSRDALIEALATPDRPATAAPLVATAVDASGLADPEAAPAIVAGLATVQDLAAQVVGFLCAPSPGQRILDACAGHGGKSTHLAELADDRASIDSADLAADKLRRLAGSARRLGLQSIRTVAADLARADAPVAAAYDLVLLDAPCTGLGVLRRHPEAKWRLRPTDPAAAAAVQRDLLDACAARVAPGGALVYAVCSLTIDEGPAQLDAFLARHPDFAIEAPTHAGVDWAALVDDRGQVRVWPHRHGGDGFFAAKLRRAPQPATPAR